MGGSLIATDFFRIVLADIREHLFQAAEGGVDRGGAWGMLHIPQKVRQDLQHTKQIDRYTGPKDTK